MTIHERLSRSRYWCLTFVLLTSFATLMLPKSTSGQGLELSGGWAHNTGDFGTNGFSVGGAWWFTKHVTIAGDYDSSWNTTSLTSFQFTTIGSTAVKSHLQNFVFGPRIFFSTGWTDRHRLNPFAEAEFGGSELFQQVIQVNKSVSESGTAFSWMVGGGVDYLISPHWSARGRLDFLRTHFAEEGQSRLRLVLGITYTFGSRERSTNVPRAGTPHASTSAPAPASASASASASVTAAPTVGEKAEVKGFITSRTGETLGVRSDEGRNVTVVLTVDTRTKDDTGLFGLSSDEKADTVLIPGLKLHAEGVSDDRGRIVAKTITVDGDDLETSEMIQAGLNPTAEQVAANMKAIEANQESTQKNAQDIAEMKKSIAVYDQKVASNKSQVDQDIKTCEQLTQRFESLGEYDVTGRATVKFPVGSSDISSEDQEQLKQLAQNAVLHTGYLIEVVGYADASGDAKMNEQLSEDRAKAVVSKLIQEGGVPVHRVVAPGAMGEYAPVASNETSAGRAENRRVEVRVLVNKNVAGSA
jgi:OmpA-OmpF porin, OOP family